MSVATRFHYRAIRGDGAIVSNEIEANSEADAVGRLRREGVSPIALRVVAEPSRTPQGAVKRKQRDRNSARALIGELAVLLKAGLPLDRALGLAIGNAEDARSVEAMGALLRAVPDPVDVELPVGAADARRARA